MNKIHEPYTVFLFTSVKMVHTHKIIFITVLFPILLSSNLLEYAEAANILVFGAVGTHSTRISMFPLMEALAEKRHSVTHLSAYENFEDPDKKSKIHYYTTKKWSKLMGAWEDHIRFFDVRKAKANPQMWLNVQEMGITACESLYSDPEYINWVKSSKFDLVLIEAVFNECGYGLAPVFNAKMVIYGTSTVMPWFPDGIGIPDESSTVPDVIFDFPPGERMSFFERVKNALSPIVFNIKRNYTYFPGLEEITRKGLGLGENELPSFREVEKNTSLVLLTTHFTIDLPRSLPPHVIPIGGAVVGSKKAKPLPKEIENFINSAQSGFIYISFGTVAEFTNFDREVQLEFIQALYSFPEIKFLWKASIQINETLPENVMLTKWAPQQTVLDHPKLKAFITHCDMGSTTESVYFGVPLILLPVLAEQDTNANAIEAKGAGFKLEITTLKKHELEGAISEILNNKNYRNAMKQLSVAFKDRPSKPVEDGVWWIEYILRHKNSNDYLVPLSVRQPWCKRRQIDVWLAISAALLTAFVVSLRATCLVIKALTTGSDKAKKSKIKYN